MKLVFALREDKSKIYFLQFKKNGIFYPVLEIIKQLINSVGFPFGVLLATAFSFYVTNKQEMDYFVFYLVVICCVVFLGMLFFMFVLFARLYKKSLKIINSEKADDMFPKFKELQQKQKINGVEEIFLADVTLQQFCNIIKNINEAKDKTKFSKISMLFMVIFLILIIFEGIIHLLNY